MNNNDSEYEQFVDDLLVLRLAGQIASQVREHEDHSVTTLWSQEALLATSIVAKSYHWYAIPYGFGSHHRVLLAIGGLSSFDNGILVANSCFVTLYVTNDMELITYDIHENIYR